MQGRSLVWVGLFGGLAAVLAVWLVMGDGSATTSEPPEMKRSARDALEHFDPKRPDAKPTTTAIPSKLTADDLRKRTLGGHQGRPALLTSRSELIRRATRSRRVFSADDAGMADVIKLVRPELDSCFRTARFHEPELSGTLVLSLEVAAIDEEKLGLVGLSTDLPDDVDTSILEGCFVTVFEDIKFKGEPTTLSHALSLTAEE